MTVQRREMKFLVPLDLDALGRSDLTGRAIIPMYISPQTVKINDKKLITETVTKGGYVVQYWGEALGEINAVGTTGSGGIEAINILKDVYRNETTQFNKLLDERAGRMTRDVNTALGGISVATGDVLTGIGSGVTSLFDELTQGSVSGVIDGVSSLMDEITDKLKSVVDNNSNAVELIPGIGAFAVSMIIYWQGEKFTGYFKTFMVDESAASPGLFDYTFTFMITKRTGVRSNFMPWHRSPVDAAGEPITVSTPREGQRLGELTFESDSTLGTSQRTQDSISGRRNGVLTTVNSTQDSTNDDENRVPLNRGDFIRGS